MRRAFEVVVSALCYSLLDERCPPSDPDWFLTNDVVRFVLAQHARMPDYLRLPLLGLTLCFDYSALLWTGQRFYRGDRAARARHVQRWRGSRFGVCRDLLRFYESLAVFGWHSLNHERQHNQVVSQSAARRALAG